MQSLPSAIFAEITPSQQKALVASLVKNKISFDCKCSSDESIYILIPVKIQDDRYIYCEKSTDPIPLSGQERVIICFDVGVEKYFMQATIVPTADSNLWKIDSQTTIFKLQRRQSFRISIPSIYKSKAILRSSETNQQLCVGVLTDISSGGCKVLVEGSSLLKGGEMPLIDIYIGRRDPITLSCEIRNVIKLSDPHAQDSLGIMFRLVNSATESKLFAITLELHRELIGKILGS